jgi:hypothetical protein
LISSHSRHFDKFENHCKMIIISKFAGLAALVGQISKHGSAASVPCNSKGSSGQRDTHCNFGDCKVIITPSDKMNSNSKCR